MPLDASRDKAVTDFTCCQVQVAHQVTFYTKGCWYLFLPSAPTSLPSWLCSSLSASTRPFSRSSLPSLPPEVCHVAWFLGGGGHLGISPPGNPLPHTYAVLYFITRLALESLIMWESVGQSFRGGRIAFDLLDLIWVKSQKKRTFSYI